MLTAESVRATIDYDPATGEMRWRADRNNRVRAGHRAGSMNGRGYISIEIDGRSYLAHRVAWLHAKGSWPNGVVDHINGDCADNRLTNLRDVSRFVNMQNRRRASSNSKSGLLGACPSGGKFRSTITVAGKTVNLGDYDTAEAAHLAYISAKRDMHQGCTI